MIDQFKPKGGEDYVERKRIMGGMYSGYILNERRHGPGTWVTEDGAKRFEGIWSNDHFCVGKG